MARKEIGTGWNRDNRNNMNYNFKETFAMKQTADDAKSQAESASTTANTALTNSEEAKTNASAALQYNVGKWLEPVSTYADISTTYPNPEGNDRVWVRDTGKAYVYRNSAWEEFMEVNETQVNEVDNRLTSQLAEKANEVTPLLFGAVGDGVTDDRLALIATFKYAMDNNYTVNLLDNKTYAVNSKDESLTGSNLSIFEIDKKIQINGRSTIKIGLIGDYDSVFRLRAGCSGSSFNEFTLDENTKENLTTDNAVTVAPNGKRRISFYGWNATTIEDIVFDGIKIKNCIGVWQIQAKANNSRIQNITVEYEKDNNGIVPAYDRTCIYMCGYGWVARDNKLIGYSEHARTGIETHGSNIIVDNNEIIDFTSMLYIVNNPQSGITNLETVNIVNNNFKCRRGLQLWFSFSNCNIKNVNILNNTLEVTGDYPVISTQRYPGQSVIVDNVKIASNTLIHNSLTSPFMSIYSASDTTITDPALIYKNIIIQDNVLLGQGEYVFEFVVQKAMHHVIKSLKILNNTINIAFTDNYLIRILDEPYAFEDVLVKGNVFNILSIGSTYSNVRFFIGAMGTRITNYGFFKVKDNEYNLPSSISLYFANNEGSKFLSVSEEFDIKIADLTAKNIYRGIIRDTWGQSEVYENGTLI